MGYSSGFMHDRVTVYSKSTNTVGQFGRNSGGVRYALLGTFWASIKFDKGIKSLREGAMDAYDTVMVRLRYNEDINRDCVLLHKGKYYNIQSLNAEYSSNEIQITAQERPDKVVTVVSSSDLGNDETVSISDI